MMCDGHAVPFKMTWIGVQNDNPLEKEKYIKRIKNIGQLCGFSNWLFRDKIKKL